MSAEQKSRKYLAFRTGREEFALPVANVREIIAGQQVTPLPATPDYVMGLINLRGRVMPVIDLGLRLAIPAVETRPGSRRALIVVIQAAAGAGSLVGAMVDEVSEVISIHDQDVEPVSGFSHGLIEPRFATAVARVRGSILVLLDVNRILARQEDGNGTGS
ncbi:MAG: chemotaxis protein CheW [Bryobacteraceae bacterium]|nr:chemotaxis protein CheW [Bryobacteraceae bacterium]